MMEEFSAELLRLFHEKDWVENDDLKVFAKLLELGSHLNEQEQDMILYLISKFEILKTSTYEGHIIQALSNIDAEIIRVISKFYVMPLIAPEDRGRTKSSTFVSYMFRNSDLIENSVLNEKEVFHVDFLEEIPQKLNNSTSKILLLVDDFVGSGQTAINCLKELIEKGFNKEKIVVVVIAAMKTGLNQVQQFGVKIFPSMIIDKGISLIQDSAKRVQYCNLMEAIENKYGIPEDLKFGYSRSEALIRLIRPPNNTFPVFWHEKMPKVVFPRK